MKTAVGSSLLVVALNSAAGFAGALASPAADGAGGELDVGFAAASAAFVGLGAATGAAVGRRLPAAAAKLLFSGGVLCLAALGLARAALAGGLLPPPSG